VGRLTAPAFLLTSAALTLASCAQPAAPSNAGWAVLPPVTLCHRPDATSSAVPLTVAASAVDGHLAHGDASIGDPVPGVTDAVFGPTCAIEALTLQTITFAGVATSLPFTTHQESGLSVSRESGTWEPMMGYGKPAPAIIFRGLAEPTIQASVRLDAGGARFMFTSVDLYSSVTPIPYLMTGSRAGTAVFSLSGTVPNTFGRFETVLNPQPTAIIDTLVITLSNPATPCCPGNPVGLDNIVAKR